jgi:hypothetical protein
MTESLFKIDDMVYLKEPPSRPGYYTNDLQLSRSGLLYTAQMIEFADLFKLHRIVYCYYFNDYQTYVYQVEGRACYWLEGWIEPLRKWQKVDVQDTVLSQLLGLQQRRHQNDRI